MTRMGPTRRKTVCVMPCVSLQEAASVPAGCIGIRSMQGGVRKRKSVYRISMASSPFSYLCLMILAY
jgi:hypothetical protein